MLAAAGPIGRHVGTGRFLGRRNYVSWAVLSIAPLLDIGNGLSGDGKTRVSKCTKATSQDITTGKRMRGIDGFEMHLIRRRLRAVKRLKNEVRLYERQLDLAGREQLGGMAPNGLEVVVLGVAIAIGRIDGIDSDRIGAPLEIGQDSLRNTVENTQPVSRARCCRKSRYWNR